MSHATYLIHGLRISAPFAIDATRISGTADLRFEVEAAGRVALDPPAGQALVANSTGSYLAVRRGLDVLLWFREACEILLKPDGLVLAFPAAGREAFAPSLLVGSALALAMALRGTMPLHATSVVTARGAYALVGDSGAGKSTMAALLCRGGGRLLSEDIQIVEVNDTGCVCHSGIRALRLRRQAEGLADDRWPAHRSPDHRLVVTPPATTESTAPLRAVVFPKLSNESEVSISRLRPAEALAHLSECPRLSWVATNLRTEYFRHAAILLRRVPALLARVPLDSLDEATGRRLRDALDGASGWEA